MADGLDKKATNQLRDGALYLEPPELDGSLRLCIGVDRVLEDRQTKYQHLQMIDAGELGNMLLLDGVPQTCDFDEAAYHEMLTHVPLLTHPEPKEVLVVGGGDGGIVRETLRHDSVERVVVCEIDAEVVRASKEHLPQVAQSLEDDRVEVRTQDAVEFMRGSQGRWDAVIIDSSDPIGPAQALYGRSFYEDVRRALKPGGVVAAQMESYFLYADLISDVFEFLVDMFDYAHYYTTNVPTYVSGVMGLALCSLGPDPLAEPDPERVAALGRMDYYNIPTHQAAFALPQRALRLLPEEVAQRQAALFAN